MGYYSEIKRNKLSHTHTHVHRHVQTMINVSPKAKLIYDDGSRSRRGGPLQGDGRNSVHRGRDASTLPCTGRWLFREDNRQVTKLTTCDLCILLYVHCSSVVNTGLELCIEHSPLYQCFSVWSTSPLPQDHAVRKIITDTEKHISNESPRSFQPKMVGNE